MKSKFLALAVCTAMLLSMSGCSSSSSSQSDASSSQASSSQTDSSSKAESSSAAESSSQQDSSSQGEKAQPTEPKYKNYASMTAEQILAQLSLEEKANQMALPEIRVVTDDNMKQHCYGGVLSKVEPLTSSQWRTTIDNIQKNAIDSATGIPIIYGQDEVHGVYACLNAVVFPHNINAGAANDKELMYRVGQITADEAKLCHMLWTYSPCVAQSVDPRWGRTYESYGSDLGRITELSTSFTKGMKDGGLIVCAKHFFADGNVGYGTGEQGDIKMIIDRGDATLTDAQIDELLKVYKAQIEAGAQTIMISHSAVNGVKMHENKKYIEKLKNELELWVSILSEGATDPMEVIEKCKAKCAKAENNLKNNLFTIHDSTTERYHRSASTTLH